MLFVSVFYDGNDDGEKKEAIIDVYKSLSDFCDENSLPK